MRWAWTVGVVLACNKPSHDPAHTSCRTNADCTQHGDECYFDSPGCDTTGVCSEKPECEAPRDYCTCSRKTVHACISREPFVRAGACAPAAKPRCAVQDCATGKIIDDGCVDDGTGKKLCSSCISACSK